MIKAELTDVRALTRRPTTKDSDDLAAQAAKGVVTELAAGITRKPSEDSLRDFQWLIAFEQQGFPIERFCHVGTMARCNDGRKAPSEPHA